MTVYIFTDYVWQSRSQIGTKINLASWIDLQRMDFWTNVRLHYENNVLTKQFLVFKQRVVVEGSDDE
jgi:hypothetical protein